MSSDTTWILGYFWSHRHRVGEALANLARQDNASESTAKNQVPRVVDTDCTYPIATTHKRHWMSRFRKPEIFQFLKSVKVSFTKSC